MTIAPTTIITEAASLLSEHGENAEYDRAIAELTTFVLGYTQDDVPHVALFLRGVADNRTPTVTVGGITYDTGDFDR